MGASRSPAQTGRAAVRGEASHAAWPGRASHAAAFVWGPAFAEVVGGPGGAAQSLAVCSVLLSQLRNVHVASRGWPRTSWSQGRSRGARTRAQGGNSSLCGWGRVACHTLHPGPGGTGVALRVCLLGPVPSGCDVTALGCRAFGGRRCVSFIMLAVIVLFSRQIKPQTQACRNRTGLPSRTSVNR